MPKYSFSDPAVCDDSFTASLIYVPTGTPYTSVTLTETATEYEMLTETISVGTDLGSEIRATTVPDGENFVYFFTMSFYSNLMPSWTSVPD